MAFTNLHFNKSAPVAIGPVKRPVVLVYSRKRAFVVQAEGGCPSGSDAQPKNVGKQAVHAQSASAATPPVRYRPGAQRSPTNVGEHRTAPAVETATGCAEEESGPQHPEVAFRTPAELRRMLQARNAHGSGQGGHGSEAASVAAASPPPRRPFASVPDGADRGIAKQAPGGTDPRVARRGGGASSSCGGGSSGKRATGQPPLAAGYVRGKSSTAGASTLAGKPGSDACSGTGVPSGQLSLGEPGPPSTGTDQELEKDFQKAKAYALSTLNRNPMATAELSKRLAARGHDPRVVAALACWLEGEGALNDALYAKLYARSKWVANLSAPAKIRKELTAKGVAAEDVEAALVEVFGPSCRIKLTGPASTEEKEVRETLLAAARKHVEQRRGSYAEAAAESRSGGNSREDWAAAAKAQAKDRDGKRRRLGMWLQYRGHDMDLVFKVFGALGI